MDLLSEFFYEVIRRIIPGLAVVVLYWHKEALTAFNRQHEALLIIVFVACVLTVAWVIGFAIEQLMFLILSNFFWPFMGEWALPVIRKCFKVVLRQPSFGDQYYRGGGRDPSFEREERRFDALLFAEKIMSRSLWGVFGFTCFKSVEGLSTEIWRPSYPLYGYLVFFFCWLSTAINDYRLKVPVPITVPGAKKSPKKTKRWVAIRVFVFILFILCVGAPPCYYWNRPYFFALVHRLF